VTAARRSLELAAVVVAAVVAIAPARADEDARSRAEAHYRAGLSLFDAGNREQALVEFRLANAAQPSPEAVFMMAQCEYHLGALRDAREHYEAYLQREAKGPLAATARLRIEAIDARPSVLAITTVPDAVDVVVEGGATRIAGLAPSEIKVPRGRYRVTVSKPNYATQVRDVELGIAETRPLFFKLDPIPARLEIRTLPGNATLYVRGARSLNPYAQNVEPGQYEVYAEATDYRPRRAVYTLSPGELRRIDFALPYVQRSGRSELIAFWTVAGAVAAGAGYRALLEGADDSSSTENKLTAISFVAAAGAVGAISAGLLATAAVPDYIPDNRALFQIGAAWTGAAEGATLALAIDDSRSLGWAWVGGATGLAAGASAGFILSPYAPNYGRAATIQSATAAGFVGGMVAHEAFKVPLFNPAPADTDARRDEKHLPLFAFTGLNVGLLTGLALAYLPDQSQYGPSWRRVVLIDLGGLAGGLTGVLLGGVYSCVNANLKQCNSSGNDAPSGIRLARFALVGSGIGFVASWFLTRHFDARRAAAERASPPIIPAPTVIPTVGLDGRQTVVPGLAAAGAF
jgi:hypothetical protein